MTTNDLPSDFVERCKAVTAKRPRTVIEHILTHGYITTEELKEKYGYNHPPRAARDMREQGIPLETFRVIGSDGRKIGAYRFGDPAKARFSKLSGRTAFAKALKADLINLHESRCAIYLEEFDPQELQIDHRIPFEVAGDNVKDINDLRIYMLLCGSANRAKSWSCEHCVNWQELKNSEICQRCSRPLGSRKHSFPRTAKVVMYPKAFFDNYTGEPVQDTCFVVMPFAKEFTPTFKAIQKALEKELGFTCTRTNELLGGGHIIEDILRGIASSELIVADVTGKNANVYYELGIAHMSKPVEKVILLCQAADEIPFDLRQFRHIIYKPGAAGLNALIRSLSEAASAISKPIYRIFVDQDGRGYLSKKLMGADHCLYEFRIEGGLAGHRAAKFGLEVIRHVMDDGHKEERAYSGGMGLMLGERQPIANLAWDIAFEQAPDGKTCFRIYESTQEQPPKIPGRRRART